MSRISAALQVIANAGVSQLPAGQWAPLLGLGLWGQMEQRGGRSLVACALGAVHHQLAGARQFASASSQQDEKQSTPSASSGSDRTPAGLSLKDLLQVSGARIAQGEVSRLADVNADLTAAAAAARMEASLMHPRSETISAADRAPQQATEQQQSTTTSGTSEAEDSAASSSIAAQQQQQQRLLHPKYGYAALGGVLPVGAEESGAGVAGLVGALTAQHPRVHPKKTFMPGETYEPQDLNPFAVKSQQQQRRRGAGAVPRPTPSEVLEKADYKNVAFLARWFLSPAGRLLPRKQTKLPVPVHKYVCRQIKLARHMGLMAGEARLDKMHLPRLREQELLEAQQRALFGEAGAAGGSAKHSELLDFGA